MTEKRPGPAPGAHIIEVSVKRELTVIRDLLPNATNCYVHAQVAQALRTVNMTLRYSIIVRICMGI